MTVYSHSRNWLVSALFLLVANCLTAAEFIPLGFSTSSRFPNDQLRVSEDGAAVIGVTPDIDLQTKRQLLKWTDATGPVIVLDDVLVGVGITADASTMVTSVPLPSSPKSGQQLIKITDGVIDPLPESAVIHRWQSPIISQDGRIIFGMRDSAYTRWTDEGTMILPIHGDDGSVDASGWATSADGSVVIGGRGPGRDTRAFRWTEDDGMQELPLPESLLLEADGGMAYGVSSDGRWTVGSVRHTGSPWLNQAIRWEGAASHQVLPTHDSSAGAQAHDVTADGRIVVGRLYYEGWHIEAGIWTEETGEMVPLQGLLESDFGLADELSGWQLTSIVDVTNDGRFVVGHAVDRNGIDEAFLVDFGPADPGDFNRDGRLDVTDINQLSRAVRQEARWLPFDLTGDELVNQEDRTFWVHRLKRTFFGDANLDGEFNGSDFVTIFLAGKYESGVNADWAEGDWNGDGKFDTSDMVVAFLDGGYEQGPRAVVMAVPEPTSSTALLTGLMGFTIGRLRRRTSLFKHREQSRPLYHREELAK